MEIYAGNINDFTIEYLAGLVTPDRVEKSMRFRFESDRKRTLLAHALLNHAVCVHYPDIKLPVNTVADKYGKPHVYTREGREIYFSLSHSGDHAICAVDENPVGADIEEIKVEKYGIADRFFASEERKYVYDDESFYRIWTLKESFIKAVGLGLRMPMDAFSVCDLNEYDGTCRFKPCKALGFDGIEDAAVRSLIEPSDGYFMISGMTLTDIPGYSLSYSLCNVLPENLNKPDIYFMSTICLDTRSAK